MHSSAWGFLSRSPSPRSLLQGRLQFYRSKTAEAVEADTGPPTTEEAAAALAAMVMAELFPQRLPS